MLVEKVSSQQRSQKLFDDFVKESSETFTLSKLLIPQKPLTSSEKRKKNELQRIINSLGEAYNLSPEVISTNKSLIQIHKRRLKFTFI